jgi:hypothetical protein
MEKLMTEANADQAHLDLDVRELGQQFAIVVAELKAQAANAGTPLNFTNADALVATVTGEATADAPPVPANAPTDPAPGQVATTAATDPSSTGIPAPGTDPTVTANPTATGTTDSSGIFAGGTAPAPEVDTNPPTDSTTVPSPTPAEASGNA